MFVWSEAMLESEGVNYDSVFTRHTTLAYIFDHQITSDLDLWSYKHVVQPGLILYQRYKPFMELIQKCSFFKDYGDSYIKNNNNDTVDFTWVLEFGLTLVLVGLSWVLIEFYPNFTSWNLQRIFTDMKVKHIILVTWNCLHVAYTHKQTLHDVYMT